jgi:hypothetical protein
MRSKTPELYSTTRIWLKTIKKLGLIGALTGESIVSTLDRLVDDELKRLKQEPR